MNEIVGSKYTEEFLENLLEEIKKHRKELNSIKQEVKDIVKDFQEIRGSINTLREEILK